jgi:hypothetical protein
MVFYYKVPIAPPTLPQTLFKNLFSFSPDLLSLGGPKLHHHDSKPTKIQNSKLQCSMTSPCPKCHVHPNHVIILPP